MPSKTWCVRKVQACFPRPTARSVAFGVSGVMCLFLLTFTIFLFSPLTEDTQQEPGEAWKRNFLITASRTKGPSVHQRNSDSPSPSAPSLALTLALSLSISSFCDFSLFLSSYPSCLPFLIVLFSLSPFWSFFLFPLLCLPLECRDERGLPSQGLVAK